MRFWQAVVTGQMAAGAVYADRFTNAGYLLHLAADAGNVVLCGIAWIVWKRLFGSEMERGS